MATGGFLAVECDNAGEDAGNLLGRIELAGLLAGTGGKLADQILVGVSQRVLISRKLRESLGNGLNDGAQLGIARDIVLTEFL